MTREQILESFQQLLDEKPVEHIYVETETFIAMMNRLIQESRERLELYVENKLLTAQIREEGILEGSIIALDNFNFIYK